MDVEKGNQTSPPKPDKKTINWTLILLSGLLSSIGLIGGPLLIRFYYLHKGQRQWLATSMKSAGFPVLFIPLALLFIRSKARGVTLSNFLMDPKLFLASGIIGFLIGLVNFMYSLGLSYIPASTSSLLYSTQFAFLSVFAWLIVKHKFTPFTINSVVLMTLGSILLGAGSGDRTHGVSHAHYLAGFFLTLGSAALLGLVWTCIELSYKKSNKPMNYGMILQFQINISLFATVVSIIGMSVNKDFEAMGRESNEYDLGHNMYYVLFVVTAIAWQCSALGATSMVFFTSSLCSGVLIAILLPISEIAAVFAYKENFNAEKGMSLALCLWGFISYFYGEYKSKEVENSGEIEDREKEEKVDAMVISGADVCVG